MLSSDNKLSPFLTSCKHLSTNSSYDQLTELNLSNLNLIKIDYFPFEQFPNLHSLDLSSNQLTFINPDWSKLYENSIECLNLSQNKLETLLFLKDFNYLKTLNITKNFLANNERFLSLYICPTIEHLIDFNQEQIQYDQDKLKQLLLLIDHLQLENVSDPRQLIINTIEKQDIFSKFHLSPLGNYFIENILKNLSSKSKQNLKSYLTTDFNFSMNIKEEPKDNFFIPIKFLRSHQQSNDDLINIPVHMCAFEPNLSSHILATCGGQKVCFIDCHTCEITHLFEISLLPSTNRKIKDTTKKMHKDYFSCLCWIEIDDLKILAVGATNGSIYLLSYQWNLMFGHIELPTSSISCLTWHSSNPYTLVIGSYHTLRYINIRSYIHRLRHYIRKQNKPCVQFDYDDSSVFVNKVSSTYIYNLYDGVGPLIFITDLLFYALTKDNLILLIGTNLGLFVIQHQEQAPMQLPLPKSIWTVSEYIESIRLINSSSHLIAMNILHLDQIYCFDLEKSLQYQQLSILFTIPNPSRQIPTKMAIYSISKDSFECIIGNNHGSFYYHQIQSSHQQNEIPWSPTDTSSSNILSSCLNEHYLCLTTTNNLICIYKRQ